MDFPRAWEIARKVPIARVEPTLATEEVHDPKCSYAIAKGGVLCDCHVLTQHPEYIRDYAYLKEVKVVLTTQDRINQIHSVLGKIVNILSRINEGGYMGDIEQCIDEVQNDLSEMQETD